MLIIISDCAVLDIVFVVDESGSICDEDPSFDRNTQICNNWRAVRAFLREFVLNLRIGDDDIHVGLLTFRDNVEVDWLLDRYACAIIENVIYTNCFQFSYNSWRNWILSPVFIWLSLFLFYRYTDQRSLLDAVDNLPYVPFGRTFTADAIDMMRTGVFTQAGDRPGVTNVGILLTDGIASPPQRPFVDGRAAEAKRDGIVMFRYTVNLRNITQSCQEIGV